jgi:hypothetical protein
VVDQVRALLRQPEIVVGTWRAARAEAPDLTEAEVRDALGGSIRSGMSCSRRAGADRAAAGRARGRRPGGRGHPAAWKGSPGWSATWPSADALRRR